MDVRRLAPLLTLAAIALAILLVAPEIYTGTFSDLETFLRASVLVVGLGVWVVLARRLLRPAAVGVVVAAVPVAVALWFVLWPYVRPATEVDEAFPPVTAEPVELGRATFQGLTGHRGSGDAALYRLADGSILLRFEEVDIGSGPDLEVYVVPGDDQRGLGGGTHVAALTAERGNQNYFPPDTVDLTTGTWTVRVWCETFAVEVANATLTT